MDENVKAASVVGEATEGNSPLDLFQQVIEDARDLLDAGESPSNIAARLWPRVVKILPSAKTAAELGRRGGRKGGKARAENLTPERRSEIAKRAAEARWGKRDEGV